MGGGRLRPIRLGVESWMVVLGRNFAKMGPAEKSPGCYTEKCEDGAIW